VVLYARRLESRYCHHASLTVTFIETFSISSHIIWSFMDIGRPTCIELLMAIIAHQYTVVSESEHCIVGRGLSLQCASYLCALSLLAVSLASSCHLSSRLTAILDDGVDCAHQPPQPASLGGTVSSPLASQLDTVDGSSCSRHWTVLLGLLKSPCSSYCFFSYRMWIVGIFLLNLLGLIIVIYYFLNLIKCHIAQALCLH